MFANGEGSPHLKRPYGGRSPSPNGAVTPTSKHNDLLNITRLRRHGVTESEEIWEELEDDTISELSPLPGRKSSARSTPSSKPTSKGDPMDGPPNESTALLSRSGTSRSYRDKGRRRSTHLRDAHEHDRRRSTSSQDALGGWWKMKRWFKGKDRKGAHRPDDRGNGNGAGHEA